MTELVTNVIEFMAAKRDMTELYPCLCMSVSVYKSWIGWECVKSGSVEPACVLVHLVDLNMSG